MRPVPHQRFDRNSTAAGGRLARMTIDWRRKAQASTRAAELRRAGSVNASFPRFARLSAAAAACPCWRERRSGLAAGSECRPGSRRASNRVSTAPSRSPESAAPYVCRVPCSADRSPAQPCNRRHAGTRRASHAHLLPGPLDRAETLGVFIETLELVHGLRRAGRLWLPTLEELVGWWLETGRQT